MKPRDVVREPGQIRPDGARQRHDARVRERATAGLDHHPPVGRDRERVGLHADADRGQVLAQRRGRGLAEGLQRRALRRVDRDLDVVAAHAVRLPGGHQRELVRGQRPRDADRDHERDALAVALVDVAQQATEHLVVGLGRPGRRAREDGLGAGAHGHQQGVVAEPLAAGRDHLAVRSSTSASDPRIRRAPASCGDPLQRLVLRDAAAERLGHRHRAVDELALGREQRCTRPARRRGP